MTSSWVGPKQKSPPFRSLKRRSSEPHSSCFSSASTDSRAEFAVAEAMNWLDTVTAPCPFCGYDAQAVARGGVAAEFARLAERWVELLGAPSGLRTPGPGWTALEYACHTRDVLTIFAERIDAVRRDEPIGWWDHEAAVLEEAYNGQDPSMVAPAIVDAAAAIGAAAGRLAAEDWSRSAERRPGEVFTIDALVRFAQHEAFHHHQDAAALL